ncbi:MAG: patatin-like phospholipase family protein, partial [Roseibium sp.]
GDDYMKVHMHRISAGELKPLQASSKLNAEWAFLTNLRDIGRQTAKDWLARHYDDIGNRSTLQIRDEIT